MSWLLIPLLWVGTDPLVAMKLLGIVIGLAVLVTAARLGRVVSLNRASCRLLVGTLVPIVLYCAYSVVTPDLLETLLVAAYLSVILRRDFLERRSFALAAGCLGALAFLAKAYALPFVGVTFVCLSLWQRFAAGASWRRLFFTWLLFGAAFAAVAAPWVVLISWKYHKLTCGTTGGFNFALIGPETIEHPMWSQGLFAPPNPFALSAWEDLGLLPFRPGVHLHQRSSSLFGCDRSLATSRR